MEATKRIPYGVADFERVIEENMYYVDKTMYLPLMEQQPNSLFFIRPRRFGKSLFLNMLRAYYDIKKKDRFEKWFGHLWIGKHPTPLQGKFLILFLDFSQVGGDIASLPENFNLYCRRQLDGFMDTYAEYYSERTRERFYASTSARDKLDLLQLEIKENHMPLYLIIDEYDNFTNVVLNEQGEEVYHALTHASGFYRDIFKKFKTLCSRIFITGVSPVTLDDLTSGFNIGWHLSTNPQFNRMLGFSEEDVREMFRYYQEAGALKGDIEEMIEEMKPWYDNYCFAEESLRQGEHMFNSDMVLYYLQHRVNYNRTPKQMIDPNTRTDYSKMKKLIQLDKLDGDRKGVLRKITEEGEIIATLEPSFPANRLTAPEIFPSLLFYYGMLTIKGTRGDRTILSIPNNNVRKQYYEYALEEYQSHHSIGFNHLKNLFDDMAFDGRWQEAMDFIARAYKENSSVRSAIEGERNLQGFFTAYLSINAYYLIAPEVELNHGFCDLFLMPDHSRYPEVAHSYIIELKYLAAKDSAEKAEAQWTEAVKQIHGYAEGAKVQQMCRGTELHRIVMQFRGWEPERMEEV